MGGLTKGGYKLAVTGANVERGAPIHRIVTKDIWSAGASSALSGCGSVDRNSYGEPPSQGESNLPRSKRLRFCSEMFCSILSSPSK